MPIAVVAASVGLAATVGSTVMGISAANKQKRAVQDQVNAQMEIQRVERARAAILAQRDRVVQLREARIRRANVISGASTAGIGITGGSSGLSGATSAIQSNLGHNIGSLGTMSSFAQQISIFNQKSAEAQSQYYKAGAKGEAWQSIFGAVGQVAGGISGFMAGGNRDGKASLGGGNEFQSIFAGM